MPLPPTKVSPNYPRLSVKTDRKQNDRLSGSQIQVGMLSSHLTPHLTSPVRQNLADQLYQGRISLPCLPQRRLIRTKLRTMRRIKSTPDRRALKSRHPAVCSSTPQMAQFVADPQIRVSVNGQSITSQSNLRKMTPQLPI